jgi:hypothetical protein
MRPAVNVNFHHLCDLVGGNDISAMVALIGAEPVRAGLRNLELMTLERADLVASGHPAGALLQSYLADVVLARGGTADEYGVLEAEFGPGDRGVLAGFESWVDGLPRVEPGPPSDIHTLRVGNDMRLAIFGDWASGLTVSDVVSSAIGDWRPDVVVHLGDVYYAGTPAESRAYLVDRWPRGARVADRALYSNHEMYSGGAGYFGITLPALRQESAAFVVENDFWVVVGLDTGTLDGRIGPRQLRLVHDVEARLGSRRMILLSHHPLYSIVDGPNEALITELDPVLRRGGVAAWYWGHDHECVRYSPTPPYDLHAVCAGHGSFPYLRRWPDAAHPSLRKVTAPDGCPPAVVLDGPGDLGRPGRVGPAGWVSLAFSGAQVVEHLVDTDGVARFAGVLR